MTRQRQLVVLAAAAGAVYAFTWLPIGIAPLLPLAFVLLMRGLRLVTSRRDAITLAVVFAVVRVVCGGHYILGLLSYSALAPALLVLDTLYYVPFDLANVVGALWLERRARVPRTLAFGLLFAVLELLRTWTDLSNPSAMVGHAFGLQPQWLAWNAWAGPLCLSVLAPAVAALIDVALERDVPRARRFALAAAAIVLWIAPPATDLVLSRSAGEAGPTLRVGIVQPSFTIGQKLDRNRWSTSWETLRQLTRDAAKGADLVVWPETTRPGPIIWQENEPFRDPEVEAIARDVGIPILYGCEIARASGTQVLALYNGAALARPDGAPGAWYAKQQLLPFVEGLPFARLIGWDPARAHREHGNGSILTLAGNFTPGTEATLFAVGPARIGVMVCYEGMYPELARRYRAAGANALVVMTNDAWWGKTVFAAWHARMVSARARENGLPVLRAANSGLSSVTDRSGRMSASTGLFEVTTLQVPLTLAGAAPTLYARTGNVVGWLLLATVAALFVRGVFKKPTGSR